MSELLLGIDVGTYSSKGVLVRPDGTIVKSATVPHTMDIPYPGWAEQDADGVWWNDVLELCRELIDGDSVRGSDIAAVAVSAIGPCLLPLDSAGRPLRKGILYGVDTRAVSEIAELTERLGEDAVIRHSGMAFTSQAIGPKIRWLQRHEPEVWAATHKLHTASSYLVYRLTGEHVMDRHTASHYMPLIDIHSLEWNDALGSGLAERDLLPRLGWSDEQAGVISAAAAEATGLAAGTPVAVGAVDALSEAISAGVTRPGDLMIMYGSTTFFILIEDEPHPDPRVWTTAGAFEGQYALAAGMSTTGSLTRWFRDHFARDLPEDSAYQELFDGAQRVPPGAEGLLLLPYFSGERTPINDPLAKGVLAGLTLAHGRDHLYRSVLEGVALGIRHNLDTFQAIGAPIDRIMAVGGGAQSETWPQIVSDASHARQHIPGITLGASYGDAYLAGLCAGLVEPGSIHAWNPPQTSLQPNEEYYSLYDQRYRQYQALYRATRDIVHGLGAN
ncbi:MAG: FGGY-family carbohydrate kinase [Acidihalobacter sp.]|uniref:FGGY-family carbohydrate kinase n=1 Tax=Acidihalobacter sp. TaxID=1872108 RepID=UPI00307E3BAA